MICWDIRALAPLKAFDGHRDKVYRQALYLEGRSSDEGGVLFTVFAPLQPPFSHMSHPLFPI